MIAATETRVELFAAKRKVGTRFVMASRDGHRVVAMLWITGHDEFNSLQSAWGQHEQHLAGTDKAASTRLSLSRCVQTVKQGLFDTDTSDIVTFEQLSAADLPRVTAALAANVEVLGAAVLADESGERIHLMTRTARAIDAKQHFHIIRSWNSA